LSIFYQVSGVLRAPRAATPPPAVQRDELAPFYA
jgi:hypothetical protein